MTTQHSIIKGNAKVALTLNDGTLAGYIAVSDYIERDGMAYFIFTLYDDKNEQRLMGNGIAPKGKLSFADLTAEAIVGAKREEAKPKH